MKAKRSPSDRRRSFISTKSFIRGIILGLFISLIVALLSILGLLSGWENRVFDFMMWWQKEERSTEIFLVEIDSQDYRDLFNSVSPLSRKTLARIIDKVSMAKPKAICLDISLRDKTDEDGYLIESLDRLRENDIPVVLSSSIQKAMTGERITYSVSTDFPYPPPGNVLFGATNFPISEEETIREMRLLRRMDDGSTYPFISLSIVAASENVSWPDLQKELDNTARSTDFESKAPQNIRDLIRTGLKSQRQKIYFIGNKSSFNSLRISDIDKMPDQSFQAGNIFSDKILLIGGTFSESKDFYRTPKGIMSGVEIIANSAETLLTSKPIKPINYLLSLLFEFVIVLLLSFMFLRFPLGRATLLSSLSIVPLSIIGSQVAFATMSRWLDFMPVALAVFFHGEASLIEHYRNLKKEVRDLRSRLDQSERDLSEIRISAQSIGPNEDHRRRVE